MHLAPAFPAILIVLGILQGTLGTGLSASEDSLSDKAQPTSPKSSPSPPPDDSQKKPKPNSTLRMSRAVACRSIDGFEQYEPLGKAGLTSDEKLLVYYRPQGYKVVRRKSEYVVHFSQDGKIRRKGEKGVLRFKHNLLDLETPFQTYPGSLYLRNTVSLKNLAPGTYEFEIILRDENAPGQTVTQTLEFRVVASKEIETSNGQPSSD